MIMKKRKGFTLIEVIVSILLTVMTVLAAHAGITSSMRITTESYRKRAAIHETENIMKCLSTENFISALNLYANVAEEARFNEAQFDFDKEVKYKKVYIYFDKDNKMIGGDQAAGLWDKVFYYPIENQETGEATTVFTPQHSVWWICIDFSDVTRHQINAEYNYKGTFKIHAETVRGAALYDANFEK